MFAERKAVTWINCKTKEEAIAQFETSLKQTGAGYFDFYLLHNLGEGRTKYFDDFDLWNWVQEKKKEGLIKICRLFFPFDTGRAGRNYNKPVIIMEPVKGGMLANPPKQIQEIFKKAEPDSSVASWAVRFAANLDGVITVLSGMSNVEQMKDNLSYMKDFSGLTKEQEHVLEAARHQEDWLVKGHGKASATDCIQCGKCEQVCPQHITIRSYLTDVSEKLLKK